MDPAPAFALDVPAPADASAIARIHVEGWRFAYAGRVPAEHLGVTAIARRTAQWEQILADVDPTRLDASYRVVRDAHGAAAGFCVVGPVRDSDAPADLELWSLYLRTDLHGTDAARAMAEDLLDSRPAFVWVADPNPRAQAFYAKLGFRPDGAHKHDPELDDLREIRMVRTAAPADVPRA